MALDVNSLVTQRDSLVAALAELMLKPSYSIEGRSYQWTAQQAELRNQIDTINKLIDLAEGPIEQRTEGF